MSFDEEWAQLVAAAAERQRTRTQLNSVAAPAASSAPQGDLSVASEDLAAIGDEAFDLYQRLNQDGDHAQSSTYKAGRDLKRDFELGVALETVADKWKSQVDTLLQACGHISNHLDYTKKAHADDEHHIGTTFSVIELYVGFDERTQS